MSRQPIKGMSTDQLRSEREHLRAQVRALGLGGSPAIRAERRRSQRRLQRVESDLRDRHANYPPGPRR